MIRLPIVNITISDVITDGFYHEYQVMLIEYSAVSYYEKLRIRVTSSLHNNLNSFYATFQRDGKETIFWYNEDEMGKWLDDHQVVIGTIMPSDRFTLTESGLSLLTSIPYLSHENVISGVKW